jgi:hypothetical protein
VVFVLGLGLAAAGRFVGVVVVALTALLMLVVLLLALVRNGLQQQNAADAVLVFAGIPLAIAAVVAAVQTWRTGRAVIGT